MVGEEDSDNKELNIDEYYKTMSRNQKLIAESESLNNGRCQSKGIKNISDNEATLIEYGGFMSKAIFKLIKFRASTRSKIDIEAVVSMWLNEKWIGSRIC